VCDVEAPTLSRQSAQKWQRLSDLHAGSPLPQEDYWYSFLLEAESTPGP
jgi:hypothetical protein